MKFRNCFVVTFLLMVICPALAYAEQNATDPNEPIDYHKPEKDGAYPFLPWWISRLEFRLMSGSENLAISNLPDPIRQVTEYNRGIPHTLPSQTGGSLTGVGSFGFGISFADLNWLEFTLDFTFRDSNYTGGETTWSQIGFPSDDFLGYTYEGFSIDPALKIVPVSYSLGGWEVVQAYFKIGLQKHFDTISSGTDAWNQFTAENRLSVNGYSHTIGFGFVFFIFNWEYQRAISYFNQPKMDERTYYFGLVFSAEAARWCTRFHISRWFCGFA
jgi:hypothetical protein